MTDWLMVLLTLIVAFFTYLVWKVYDRIAWLTGAMESHSEIMLRVEAKRGVKGKPIKLVAWDPTIAPPPTKRKHGQKIDVDTIYVYLPMSQRKHKPSYWKRVKELIKFP